MVCISSLTVKDKTSLFCDKLKKGFLFGDYSMYLDLDNTLVDCKINDTVSFSYIDYNSQEDRDIKVNIHRSIFNGSYDCDKFIEKFSQRESTRKGISLFFYTRISTYMKCIGSCDVICIKGRYLLSNFGLTEEFRGRGFSKTCLSVVLNELKLNNVHRVFLYVDKNNDLAINLYKSFGFRII